MPSRLLKDSMCPKHCNSSPPAPRQERSGRCRGEALVRARNFEYVDALFVQVTGQAARTVLAGKASGAPKLADDPIEAIRMLRVARIGAVKARTAALNTLRSMVITAPESLRTQLRGLSSPQLFAACARLRPDLTNLAEPAQAAKHALRSIAVRLQHLDTDTRSTAATRRSHPSRGTGHQRHVRPRPGHRLGTIGDRGRQPRRAAQRGRVRPPLAALPRSQHLRAKPTGTDCTEAATEPVTAHCTSHRSAAAP